MTAWMSGWLRDIVLIILVATFVDLLIPSHSLGRYVKVVVSLIILLTILTPVISLLNEQKNVEHALEQASGLKDGSQELNLILANGARMKVENDQSSKLLVEQQVGQMVKQKLERSLSLEVQEVQVSIKAEEGVNPSIEHIQVILLAKEITSYADKEQGPRDRNVSIDQVAPVTVKVSLDNSQQQVESSKPKVERSPMQIKLEDQVMDQLKEQWGLAGNRIQVEWR